MSATSTNHVLALSDFGTATTLSTDFSSPRTSQWEQVTIVGNVTADANDSAVSSGDMTIIPVVPHESILDESIDESIRKWKINPNEVGPELRERIHEAVTAQVRSFFEWKGWGFSEDAIFVPDDVDNPEEEYARRIEMGAFYATKALHDFEQMNGPEDENTERE